MQAEAVEEHLFAEDVHFLNGDEQGNHTGANDGAGPGTNEKVSRRLVTHFIRYKSNRLCAIHKARASHVKHLTFKATQKGHCTNIHDSSYGLVMATYHFS